MEDERIDFIEQKRSWEELFKNRAWVLLQQALQAQTDTLQNEILFGPVGSSGDAYIVERKKGNLEGRLSITGTASAMYEGVCADLNNATGQTGEEDEN